MRMLVVVIALAAGLWVGWREWRQRTPSRPAVSTQASPTALPAVAAPSPLPTRPPVQVQSHLDPSDPELRAVVEELGRAVEPAIDSLSVPTVDSAMSEHARTGDLAELQARLDRILATNPGEATRLHAHFLLGKDPQFLFVLAKLAAGRLEGDGFTPWIETAESGRGDHRRFAMYALAGDEGTRSIEALTKAWKDPSAGAARPAAGFVLEGRIEELPESGREPIRVVCREELRRATDPELQAEAVTLLASPRLDARDRDAVVEVVLSDRDESVRLAALQALAVGDATGDPAVTAALDRLLGDPSTPQRLHFTAWLIRGAHSK